MSKRAPEKKPRIFWKDEERALVVEKGFELWYNSPGLSTYELINQAQLVLPKDRHRHLNVGIKKWFTEGLTAKVIEFQTAVKENERLAAKASLPPPEPPSPEEMIQMVSTASLYGEIMRRQDERDEGIARMMQTVEDRIEHVVKLINRISSIAGENPHAHILPPKPKVLIVGILPGQLEEIRKDVPGVHFGMVSSQSTMPKIPTGYDMAFCTRWCRHAMSEAAKKIYGHKYFWHDGGLDSLAKKVRVEVAALNGTQPSA